MKGDNLGQSPSPFHPDAKNAQGWAPSLLHRILRLKCTTRSGMGNSGLTVDAGEVSRQDHPQRPSWRDASRFILVSAFDATISSTGQGREYDRPSHVRRYLCGRAYGICRATSGSSFVRNLCLCPCAARGVCAAAEYGRDGKQGRGQNEFSRTGSPNTRRPA